MLVNVGITRGHRAAARTAAGVALGFGIQVLVFGLGVAAAVRAVPGLEVVIEIAGLAYLTWLASVLLRSTQARRGRADARLRRGDRLPVGQPQGPVDVADDRGALRRDERRPRASARRGGRGDRGAACCFPCPLAWGLGGASLARGSTSKPRRSSVQPRSRRAPSSRWSLWLVVTLVRAVIRRARRPSRVLARASVARAMVLSDRSIREALDAGHIVIDPLGSRLHPALLRRPPRRPVLPAVPQPHHPGDRRQGGPRGPDRAGRRGRRGPADPPPRRVRARLDDRAGDPPRRPGRPPRGQVARSAASACSSTRRPASSTPGWDGHLTLELSNVANLPITVYPGMKIGQISFFEMTTPADHPYGSHGPEVEVPGPVGPDPQPVRRELPRGTHPADPALRVIERRTAHDGARIVLGLAITVVCFAIAGRRFFWLYSPDRLRAPRRPSRCQGRSGPGRGRARRGARPEEAAAVDRARAWPTSSPCGASPSCSLTIIEAYGALFNRDFHIPLIGHRRLDRVPRGLLRRAPCSSALVVFAVIRVKHSPKRGGRASPASTARTPGPPGSSC